MAERDLTSRLLSPRSLYQPQTVLNVQDDQDSEPSNQQSSLQTAISHQNHNHSQIYHENGNVSSPNPYEFLWSGGLSVPEPTTADPFRNGTPYVSGVYEVVKIVLCFPIALVRLVLFGSSLAVGYIATRIALAGWKDKQNSMPKWRSRLMWITRVCTRFILFSFGYQWIRRKGKPAPREIAPIVVSNHVSYIEPIFYFYELFPTIVASESHDSIPFVGTIIRAMQVIYVNRFSSTSRKNAVNEIKVEYLPILMPSDHQKQNAVRFAERTGQAMASALNVVQTSHSYGDLMLLTKAAQVQQENPWSYMVEMAKIESLYHISNLEAVDFLDKFLSMNPDPSGCVKLHDFLRVLQLKPCTISEEIFGFLDVEKNGSITFKQFLFGSAHVLNQPLFKQACELAFADCDEDGDNYCMKKEFADNLRVKFPDLNDDEVNGLFSLFDMDNDGRMSRDDFFYTLRKNPLLVAVFSPRLVHKNLIKSS
ncbi:lysophospholipid acyltransferase LPEAT2-like isoform X2 [Hibiscus syriacus]|uniref:lysophospholipid acyltransferase LPEAT2-like isoform X2 n=1 Tax=Hibiscus syriacus TaxID=106335 RepID=UPI001922FC2E|nr:lysophospholipid acyltransferase LPEAT2-like isoform X2 [Hibiscus syriacus]